MATKFCEECSNEVMATMRICPQCGSKTFSPEKMPIKNINVSVSNVTITGSAHQTSSVLYAGFWERGAAYFVDMVIIMTASFGIGFILGLIFTMGGQDINTPQIRSIFLFLQLLLPLIYFASLESGEKSATLGKRFLGLEVRTTSFQRVSWGQAFGRNLGRLISALTLCIGYFMQPFTAQKQSLHDKMAGTVVMNVNSKPKSILEILAILFFAFLILCFMLVVVKALNQAL